MAKYTCQNSFTAKSGKTYACWEKIDTFEYENLETDEKSNFRKDEEDPFNQGGGGFGSAPGMGDILNSGGRFGEKNIS